MHGGKARQPVKWGKKICDGVTRFWQKLARALGPGPGPCASFFKNLARPSHICLPHLAGWLARPPCMWAPHHVFGFPTMYFDQRYHVSLNTNGSSELRMELRMPLFLQIKVPSYAT